MTDPKTFSRLRDCGRLESFSTARHHLGYYNNVAFTASYAPSHSHGITVPLPNLIYPPLRKVISQHPILSAIPVDENTRSPYFVRLPQINLQNCVSFVQRAKTAPEDGASDEELDAILEEQHNTNFKQNFGTRPFWRLVVLHDGAMLASTKSTVLTCAFIYHHALADGSSGLVFHRDFLSALQNLPFPADDINAVTPNPIVDTSTTSLLPPLEDLHPLPLSFGYLVKQQWNEWFPPSTTGLWTGNPIPTSVPRTRFKSLVLSKDTTSLLLRLSRKHGVTMNATLECLIASATFANLEEEKWGVLRASGTISLRRFLKVPDEEGGRGRERERDINEQIGTFVGDYSFDHIRHSTAVEFNWNEAAAVRETVTMELNKNLKDSKVNLLRWVSDVQDFFEKRLGQRRQESFELSNVSVVKNEGKDKGPGQWVIGRCVFSQSASLTGAAFFVSAVTGKDGCAVLGFSWVESKGSHEEGFMESVMAAIRERVEGLVRAE